MVNGIKSLSEVHKKTGICQTILAVKISIVCCFDKSHKNRVHGSEARLIIRSNANR